MKREINIIGIICMLVIGTFIGLVDMSSENAKASTPEVVIVSEPGSFGTINIYYMTHDDDEDSLTTSNWQFSQDESIWFDIDASEIGNNGIKPPGYYYITWDTINGTNNLDGVDDDSIWFRMKVTDNKPYMSVRYTYNSPDINPVDLTWDGSNLWSTDEGTNKIYKHNMDGSLSVSNTYDSPSDYPAGLTWDGSRIWSTDRVAHKIYKHNMDATLSVANSYDSPGSNPTSLAWDGTNLWSTDSNTEKIYKHIMDSSLSISATFDAPSNGPWGLTWDGSTIWSSDMTSDKIYKHNMDASLSVAEIYNSPSSYPSGLTWDGSNIWSMDFMNEEIYQHYSYPSSSYATSPYFEIDNNNIPIISNITTSGLTGDIIINYTLIDMESDICDLIVEYQGGSVGSSWTLATITEPTTGISPGNDLVLTWQSFMDESGLEANDYRIKITPSDNDIGTADISDTFIIDNKVPIISDAGPDDTQTSTSVVLTATTNENAYCRWSRVNEGYESMTNQFTMGEGGTSHSSTITASEGLNKFFISAEDINGNAMTLAIEVTFTVDLSEEDTSLPIITSAGPSGTQSNLSVILNATTDEAAYCRWSTINQGYEDMPSINQFTTGEGNTVHLTSVNAQEGENTYYISSMDVNGNAMTSAISISFIVDLSVEDTSPPNINNVGPTGTQLSLSAILTATTDENAYCRWSTIDQGYDYMPSVNQFSTGEGDISHSTVITASEGLNTYYISAQDLSGNSMDYALRVSFTVNTSITDNIPPTVMFSIPQDGSKEVSTDIIISAIFSENMNIASLTTASVVLKDSQGGIVSGSVSYDTLANRVIFTPNADLTQGETYTVTISTGAQDLAGNSLAQDYMCSFTIKSPPDGEGGKIDWDLIGVILAIVSIFLVILFAVMKS